MSSYVEFTGNAASFAYPCGDDSECYPLPRRLKPGIYLLEVYGAQGGATNENIPKGGYSSGIISIEETVDIFIRIGSMGKCVNSSGEISPASFNGGGRGKTLSTQQTACSGGGSTHISIGIDDNFHRVIVAGGGGGSTFYVFHKTGGAGGGEQGLFATGSTGCTPGAGGTQTEGGTADPAYPAALGSFGNGGTVLIWDGGGGGGGWYGGGAGQGCVEAGGGGSGFVFTPNTEEIAINSGLQLSQRYFLGQGYTRNGNQEFHGYDTEWTIGNIGNGAAKITLIHNIPKRTCFRLIGYLYFIHHILIYHSLSTLVSVL